MMNRPQYHMSEVAAQLHSIIKQSPGIHFRSLGREAHLSSVGQLRHHLDSLRRQGAIVELEDGRFKRYFASGEHEPRIRRGLARFSRPIPKRIAMLLLTRPMNRTEIRRSLGCADSTLGYHLNRMVELGDLKRERGRNCCHYSLTEPDFIRDLLQYQCGSPPKKERKHWSDGHVGVLGGNAHQTHREITAQSHHSTSSEPVEATPAPATAPATPQARGAEPPAEAATASDAGGPRRQQPASSEQEKPPNEPRRGPDDGTSRPRTDAEVPAWLRHW